MKTLHLNWLIIALLMAIIVTTCSPHHAMAAPMIQNSNIQMQADRLFIEGRTLSQDGQLRAELTKFEAALPLYQDIGNQSREGKVMTSLPMFNGQTQELFSIRSAISRWTSAGVRLHFLT